MSNRFTVSAIFKAIDQVSIPVTKMQNRLGRFVRRSRRGLASLTRMFSRTAESARRMGQLAAVGITAVSFAMFRAISVGAQFEDTIIRAGARFEKPLIKGTEGFEKLRNAAQKAGETTEFTARQSAKALEKLALAGFDVDSAIGSLPRIIDLATSAGLDLAEAAELSVDSTGAFGIFIDQAADKAEGMRRVVDLLAKSSTIANLTVSDMFEAIKTSAPVAISAGANIEDLATLVTALAQSGIKGTLASTGIRNIALAIGGSAAGSEQRKIFKRLGVDINEVKNGEKVVRNLIDIFKDLNVAVGQQDQADQLTILNALFGKRGGPSAINLLKQTGGQIDGIRKKLLGAAGAAKKMADVIRQSTVNRWKEFLSAMESVLITFFFKSEGPLNKTIRQTTAWVRANKELISTKIADFLKLILKNLAGIVKWGKRIAIVTAVFLTLMTVIKALNAVLLLTNLIALANPYVLIAVAVLALIAAVVALIFWWDDVMASFKKFGTIAQIITVAIATLVAGPIAGIIAAAIIVTNTWGPMAGFFTGVWQAIVNVFNTSIDMITDLLDDLGLLDPLIASFEALKTVFKIIWDRIVAIVKAGVEEIKPFLKDMLFLIDKLVEGAKLISFSGKQGALPAHILEQQRVNAQRDQQNQQRVAPGAGVLAAVESVTTNKTEVTLKAGDGVRAEITGGTFGPGLRLDFSGDF